MNTIKTTAKNIPLKDVNDGKVTSNYSSHGVGTTLGTVGGVAAGVAGTIVAGAAAGSVVGPAGAALGAAVGGVVGAMAGHEIAAQINPKEEDLYWRREYQSRPYITQGTDYEVYQPAYTYGVSAFIDNDGRDFDEIESDLHGNWEDMRGDSTLEWGEARHATRDAYDRLRNRNL